MRVQGTEQPAPRRGAMGRLVAGAVVAVAALLGLAAAGFLWGVSLDAERLRVPLENLLTDAFGAGVRIEGLLRVETGFVSTVSAGALVVADPLDPSAGPLARGVNPVARIDLVALLRRTVALDEVTGTALELRLSRRADGRGNWESLFRGSNAPAPVSFAGIARLKVDTVRGTYQAEGLEARSFEIAGLDGALPADAPVSASGTATGEGHSVTFDLATASLSELSGKGPFSLKGVLGWSGARLALDGSLAITPASLDANFRLTAADAGADLARLGLTAKGAGALDAKGHARLAAGGIAFDQVSLSLGETAMVVGGHVEWSDQPLRIRIEGKADHLDLRPFILDRPPSRATLIEEFLAALDALASGPAMTMRVAVRRLSGLVLRLEELDLEGSAAAGAVALRGNGRVMGARTEATVDYDARHSARSLALRIRGTGVSSAGLPERALMEGLSGTLGGVEGRMEGRGRTPREVAASLAGAVKARDLRLEWAPRGKEAVQVRLDSARIETARGRSANIAIAGNLAGQSCTAQVSGGALAALIGGKRWPLQLSAACGALRLAARGPVVMHPQPSAELDFESSVDRLGPFAATLGVPAAASLPLAAKGHLAIDAATARLRLDRFRIGRSSGSGRVEAALGAPHAVRAALAFASLDADELASALGGTSAAPADPLDREILPRSLRLPEVGLDLSAHSLSIRGQTAKQVKLTGATRDGALPEAGFAFQWRGMPVTGKFGLDLRGDRPTASLDAEAAGAALDPLVALTGRDFGAVKAGRITVRANASGVRVGDILQSMSLEASLEQGTLADARRLLPGVRGTGKFGATIKAAPNGPTSVAASGTLGAVPFDLAIEMGGLAVLAGRRDDFEGSVRMTLDDARLQASGKFSRSGEANGKASLAGGRIDRLGRLAALDWPALGPYSVSGAFVATSDAVRATDLAMELGASRASGQASVSRGKTRPAVTAKLQLPLLRLEDIGAGRWLDFRREREGAVMAPASPGDGAEMVARMRRVLRAFDADATLQIDALQSAGARLGSGRVRGSLRGGELHLSLDEARLTTGSLAFDARLDASGAQPKGRVRASLTDFDYGPVARSRDPKSTDSGRVDLRLDLAADGAPAAMLARATGYLDAVVYPRELQSRALGFWGAGLLNILFKTVDRGSSSRLNCAVTGIDVGGGTARSSGLFIDTTYVRIVGDIEADLATRRLTGRLSPKAKRPELFQVAPAVAIGGTMGDPDVSVAPSSILMTPFRFATSPLAAFTVDLVNSEDRSPDGSKACAALYERLGQLDSRKQPPARPPARPE